MTHPESPQEEQMRALGERLKTARERSRMSQGPAAELLGTARSAVSGIESGKRHVTGFELWKLADLYQEDPEALLFGEVKATARPWQHMAVFDNGVWRRLSSGAANMIGGHDPYDAHGFEVLSMGSPMASASAPRLVVRQRGPREQFRDLPLFEITFTLGVMRVLVYGKGRGDVMALARDLMGMVRDVNETELSFLRLEETREREAQNAARPWAMHALYEGGKWRRLPADVLRLIRERGPYEADGFYVVDVGLGTSGHPSLHVWQREPKPEYSGFPLFELNLTSGPMTVQVYVGTPGDLIALLGELSPIVKNLHAGQLASMLTDPRERTDLVAELKDLL